MTRLVFHLSPWSGCRASFLLNFSTSITMTLNEEHGGINLFSLFLKTYYNKQNPCIKTHLWIVSFVLNFIHLCFLLKQTHLMSRFPKESHWPETPKEYSLQFMRPKFSQVWPFPCLCFNKACVFAWPYHKYWPAINIKFLAVQSRI